MGWTFPYNVRDKKGIVVECTSNDRFNTCLKKACYGNQLWTLWHNHEKDVTYIALFLLELHDGSYGYKFIDESMGPYYYKCPLSFLKIAPVTNLSWRDDVIDYHANKKKQKREKRAS